ncbi:N/A [soil metagenome]
MVIDTSTLKRALKRPTAILDRADVNVVWPQVERRESSNHEQRFRPNRMYGRRSVDHVRIPIPTKGQRLSRRALDLAVALPALVLSIPIFVIVAVCIKCSSRGPIFFRQTRVGREHRSFRMVKFRTMPHGADRIVRGDPALWALYVENDFKLPKSSVNVSRLGNFLRKTSLDELPQLFNVIRGDMSVVGVRPVEPEQLGERSRASQGLYGVFQPGMTGHWQTRGRSLVQGEERVALDDEYVATWAPKKDVLILLRTPLAVMRRDQSA